MECLTAECEQLVQVNYWLEQLYYMGFAWGLGTLAALGWIGGHQR